MALLLARLLTIAWEGPYTGVLIFLCFYSFQREGILTVIHEDLGLSPVRLPLLSDGSETAMGIHGSMQGEIRLGHHFVQASQVAQ